jgi:hypothetical protein
MNETPERTVDIRGLADALSTAFPSLDITDQRIAIATYRLLARDPSKVDVASSSLVSRSIIFPQIGVSTASRGV